MENNDKLYIVRFTVNGESGEWCVKNDNYGEIIDAICAEYNVMYDSVKIISITEQ